MHVAIRRVEPPLGDRPVDRALDRRDAHLRRVGDLPEAIARRQKVEIVLALRDPRRDPRPALGSNAARLRLGCGFAGHRLFSFGAIAANAHNSRYSDFRKAISASDNAKLLIIKMNYPPPAPSWPGAAIPLTPSQGAAEIDA